MFTYGRNFRLFQSASISYNLSKYNDETPDPGAGPAARRDAAAGRQPQPGSIVKTQYQINNSSLRPAYLFDSRDNPFEPTRGQKLSLAVEYAGGSWAATTTSCGRRSAYSIFRPVTNYPTQTLIAFNAEGGLIHPFGDNARSRPRALLPGRREQHPRPPLPLDLPARQANGIPLRDSNGFILGGDKYVQFNLEYHFLLGGPFRVLLFGDAGNVFGDGQSFDLSHLRYTAGVELRVLLPVFGAPLRFIYAKNLDPQPQDSFESFQFSIGTSF